MVNVPPFWHVPVSPRRHGTAWPGSHRPGPSGWDGHADRQASRVPQPGGRVRQRQRSRSPRIVAARPATRWSGPSARSPTSRASAVLDVRTAGGRSRRRTGCWWSTISPASGPRFVQAPGRRTHRVDALVAAPPGPGPRPRTSACAPDRTLGRLGLRQPAGPSATVTTTFPPLPADATQGRRQSCPVSAPCESGGVSGSGRSAAAGDLGAAAPARPATGRTRRRIRRTAGAPPTGRPTRRTAVQCWSDYERPVERLVTLPAARVGAGRCL